TYARYDGHSSTSARARWSYAEGSSLMSRTSSVIAIAKTPSLKASTRPVDQRRVCAASSMRTTIADRRAAAGQTFSPSLSISSPPDRLEATIDQGGPPCGTSCSSTRAPPRRRATPRPGAVSPGFGLDDPTTATTVRVQDGRTLTTDGPFAETKEALGGYLIFEADDLDAAIELAGRIPAAR